MSSRAATLAKSSYTSYSFNKTIVPFPDDKAEKVKPPPSNSNVIDSSHLFKTRIEPLTKEGLRKRYVDEYFKAERIVISNFYTGGGAFKKGVLDMIYKGFNPMKPAQKQA